MTRLRHDPVDLSAALQYQFISPDNSITLIESVAF
jgi:hypothetical protein